MHLQPNLLHRNAWAHIERTEPVTTAEQRKMPHPTPVPATSPSGGRWEGLALRTVTRIDIERNTGNTYTAKTPRKNQHRPNRARLQPQFFRADGT